jgi:hypothetical protein
MLESMQYHPKNRESGLSPLKTPDGAESDVSRRRAEVRKPGLGAFASGKNAVNSRYLRVNAAGHRRFPQCFPQLWKSWGGHQQTGETNPRDREIEVRDSNTDAMWIDRGHAPR